MKNKIVRIIIFLLIIVIIAAISYYFVYKENLKKDLEGIRNTSFTVEIEIEKGTYLNEIAKILKEKEIINYSENFIEYAKQNGNSSKYKYGVFSLKSDMSYEKIDEELQKVVSLSNIVKIVIPEGYELRQIIDLLVEKNLGTKENYENILKTHDFGYSFLKDITKSVVCLEGYLFPATYDFYKDAEEIYILDTMLKKFDKVMTEDYKKRAEEINMTINEVVTLASIIEREAGNDSERSIVASVFYNRLKSKTYPYLESCATVQYILKERKAILSYADIEIDSPYNTYKNKGLPPHPIASPGLESIKATLYPAESDYLFFVLGKDGKHLFSKTYQEHLNNINANK